MVVWFVNQVNIFMMLKHSNADPQNRQGVWGAPFEAQGQAALRPYRSLSAIVVDGLDGGVHQVRVVELGHVAGALAGYG